MMTLIVLFVSLLVFRGLGVLGVPLFLTWHDSALWALSAMVLFTASAHFTALKFVAMFPANINAALRQVPLHGRPATPLWLRLPMQVLFIALAVWIALG